MISPLGIVMKIEGLEVRKDDLWSAAHRPARRAASPGRRGLDRDRAFRAHREQHHLRRRRRGDRLLEVLPRGRGLGEHPRLGHRRGGRQRASGREAGRAPLRLLPDGLAARGAARPAERGAHRRRRGASRESSAGLQLLRPPRERAGLRPLARRRARGPSPRSMRRPIVCTTSCSTTAGSARARSSS